MSTVWSAQRQQPMIYNTFESYKTHRITFFGVSLGCALNARFFFFDVGHYLFRACISVLHLIHLLSLVIDYFRITRLQSRLSDI